MKCNRLTQLLMTVLIISLGALIACGSEAAPNTSSPPTTSAPTATAAATAPSALPGKLKVVTTSNIIADWVRVVGGDRVEVFPLLPANADPHTFQPGARDVAQVADASLVLSIGLSLEARWLDDLVRNAAGNSAKIIPLGDVVDPIEFMEIFEEHGDEHEEEAEEEHRDEHEEGTGEEHGDEHEEEAEEEHGDEDEEGEEHGDEHGELDPHFWFDPQRVKQAVNAVSAHLAMADPASRTEYRNNVAAYNRELDALHAWIEEQVATLPAERRLLVTSHDSFQYFANRYGFKVVGAIFPVTTGREPTAQELAELVETIQHEGAPAVFSEKSHSAQLAKRIAEETGATLVAGVYTGSLGPPGSEAGTYMDFMRYNVNVIVEALR